MSDVINDGYQPRFAGFLEAHLEQGLSLESFIGVVRHDLDVIKEWIERYPEMKAAATFGDAKGRMKLELIGLDGLEGKIKGFQFGVYKTIMEHRYGYGVKKKEELPNAPYTVVLLPSNGRESKEPKVVQGKVFGMLSSPEPKQAKDDPSTEFEDND